mmetsp:Transcript_9288/g.14662  ORF Transcript_9288/g.14662 Transcript_9288/m.14662 type:complete len:383 (-) Transcript_9288:62-1210(-)
MPLARLLPGLKSVLPAESLVLGDILHSLQNSRHHTLESAEVDVGAEVHELEDFLSVLLDLVLDVHLAALFVLLLTGESNIVAELVRVLLLHALPVLVVEEGVGVGDTEEEPGETLELVGSLSILDKETAKESTVRGNTSTSGKHDDGGLRGSLGHEHNLSGRSSKSELGTGLGIAEVVGADSLLGRVLTSKLRVPVSGTTNAEGHGLAIELITITGGCDGVEADTVGLVALGVNSGGNDTSRLSLPVRHLACMVNDNVAGLTGGLRTDNALNRNHLSGERSLVLVGVDGDTRLVVVWGGLEEIKTSGGFRGNVLAGADARNTGGAGDPHGRGNRYNHVRGLTHDGRRSEGVPGVNRKNGTDKEDGEDDIEGRRGVQGELHDA